MLAQIAPLRQPKFCTSARFFDAFHAQDDGDPAAASVSQPLAILAWLFANQANMLALDDGKRRAELS